MPKPIKLKWLIAHRPAYLFIRTAEAFATELEKLCPGEFEVEILRTTDYYSKYGDIEEFSWRYSPIPGIEERDDDLPQDFNYKFVEHADAKKKWKAMFKALQDNKIQLSQTQVTIIGGNLHTDFLTLDLPFLFNDHDHVSRVLDNEIGDELCEKLVEKDIRGLSFTYSGGYRIIGSNRKIKNLTDLENSNIFTTPSTKVLFSEIGAKSRTRGEITIDEAASLAEQGASVETTYLRFSGKYILKTNHSMFLTNILTGEKFFKELTAKQQEAFKTAAKIVAKMERQWSLEDAQKYEDEAISNGVTIIDISQEDKELLKTASQSQYEWSVNNPYKRTPPDLIDKIRKT